MISMAGSLPFLALFFLASGWISAAGLAVGGFVLLFTIPVETGLARAAQRAGGERDRIERVELAFHERVARAFDVFASSAWQAVHPECGPIVLIDATGSEAEVFGRAASALRSRWPASFPLEKTTPG